MPKLKPAFLLLITATVIWGATAPIMKLTLTQVPIFSLGFIRSAAAAVIFFPFVLKQLKFEKSDIKNLLIATILGGNLNLALFFSGLKYTEAINASIITASVPIFTLFAAHLYLKEKLTSKLILASVTALAGTLFIIGAPILSLNLKSALGNVLIILATISFVVYEIFAKNLLKKYSAATLTFYMFLVSAIVFLPFSLIDLAQNPAWISNVNVTGLLGILFGIIFASTIASYFWQKGLLLLPAGEAAIFFYLDPISGIIVAMILLGEKITASFAIGTILIVSGVFLAEHHRKNHILHKNI